MALSYYVMMTNTLTLHYAPDNASMCVKLAVLRMDIPFQTALVDRRHKAQSSADYLAINPNGLIPGLEAPDGAIFETGAILLWLADGHPGAIFPKPDAPNRGITLSWLFWVSNTLHSTLPMLFYPADFAPDQPQALHDQTRARLHDLLCRLDQRWADQPFLLHCYVAPILRWCVLYGGDTAWFDLTRYPTLFEFARAFEETEPALATAQAKGLGPTPFSAPSLPTPPEGSAT